MTVKQFTEQSLIKNGIDHKCTDDSGNGCFRGIRNGIEWLLSDTCSWDGCYQLIYNDYTANRISIKTAIKKILSL